MVVLLVLIKVVQRNDDVLNWWEEKEGGVQKAQKIDLEKLKRKMERSVIGLISALIIAFLSVKLNQWYGLWGVMISFVMVSLIIEIFKSFIGIESPKYFILSTLVIGLINMGLVRMYGGVSFWNVANAMVTLSAIVVVLGGISTIWSIQSLKKMKEEEEKNYEELKRWLRPR